VVDHTKVFSCQFFFISKELNKLKGTLQGCLNPYTEPATTNLNNNYNTRIKIKSNKDVACLIFSTKLGFIAEYVIQGPFPPQSVKKIGPCKA